MTKPMAETMVKVFMTCAGVFGSAAVVAGAVGAHVAQKQLGPEALNSYETAVRYMLIHAVVLLFCGTYLKLDPTSMGIKIAGGLFIVGIVLFCGTLLLHALTAVRIPLAPIGGMALIMAWLAIAFGAWQRVQT